jgi:hypothetical protein
MQPSSASHFCQSVRQLPYRCACHPNTGSIAGNQVKSPPWLGRLLFALPSARNPPKPLQSTDNHEDKDKDKNNARLPNERVAHSLPLEAAL